MKKTKEKILDTALELFNQHGLSQVTLRAIAKEMAISQGNLNYHYKKREDIIESLYFQMVDNIDASFTFANVSSDTTKNEANDEMIATDINTGNNLIHTMLQISDTIMINFYDYRFIMFDFMQVMRESNNVKKHYLALSEQREQQYLALIRELIEAELIRDELLTNEYKNLYTRVQILANFWMSHVSSQPTTELCKRDMLTYSDVLNQNIYPYLTEKGRIAYHSYVCTVIV